MSTTKTRFREIPRHVELTGWIGYLSSFVLVALARLGSAALPANPPAPYYLSIVLVSLWAGRGPGLVSAVLSAIATAYFDLGTGGRFDLDAVDLVRLVIFFVLAYITSALVSSRKETEESLREVIDELEELDHAKDEFIATVTHDLRSPLTSILGWAQLLKDQLAPGEQESRGALDSIIRSARVQSRLVDDLLEASRVRVGKIEMQRKRFDLVELTNEVLDSFDLEKVRQEIQLERRLELDGIVIEGDPQRIEQLLRNLVSNAFKFTPRGGVVTVALEEAGSSVRLTVSDTGSGIPPEDLPTVFQRYAQASGAKEKGGLGLGLSIVQHIAELHGGRVDARSDGEGKGATFTVEIPTGSRTAE